ncbi:MAG TPA: glycosyltransferase [Fimbriimonas sp.]|nr:glycosyltransferase [Fimbriimonas sp.]
MPRVSILLTCYNHIAYLPAALESVRAQSFRDFEVIALDDGSTDGTREWLTAQPDIETVFNVRNIGTYATLNVGLGKATGELIAVLNDDDLWAPKKLERQISLIDSDERIGLVHTNGYFIDGKGDHMEGSPLGFRFPKFITGDLLLGLVYENKIIASAALARRECFERLGGFNASYFGSGDWEMWFRIAEAYWVGFVDEPLTMYRVHGENASHKLERIWQDDQTLREWMAPRLGLLDARFSPQEVTKAKAFNMAALGTVRTLNGFPASARSAFWESIRINPLRAKTYLRYLATFLPGSTFRKTL